MTIMEQLRMPPVGYACFSWGDMEDTDWIDESLSWKTTCYVGDWSWFPDLLLKGPGAPKLLSDTSVNSLAKFDVGKPRVVPLDKSMSKWYSERCIKGIQIVSKKAIPKQMHLLETA